MTVEQLAGALKPVIEQVVRKCMQEELREILTEAVEIASRPGSTVTGTQSDEFEIETIPESFSKSEMRMPKPEWVQDLEAEQSKARQIVQESKPAKNSVSEEAYLKQKQSITGLFKATAKEMSPAEVKAFGGNGI